VSFPKADGKRHGRGVRVWASGNKYEGEWVDDHMGGQGVFEFATGGKYSGGFVNGLFEGYGEASYGTDDGKPYICPLGFLHKNRGRDGSLQCHYKGYFHEGCRHGDGTFECCDGKKYTGAWVRNSRAGYGRMEMIPELEKGNPRRNYMGGLDGMYRPEIYEGEWVDKVGMTGGCREGKGSIMFSNGIKYEGQFVGGHLEGTGKVTYKDGTSFHALFKHSGLVKKLSAAEKTQEDIVKFMIKDQSEDTKKSRNEQDQNMKEAEEYRALQARRA